MVLFLPIVALAEIQNFVTDKIKYFEMKKYLFQAKLTMKKKPIRNYSDTQSIRI